MFARLSSVFAILFIVGCNAEPLGVGLDDAGAVDVGVVTGTGSYCDVMRAVFLPSCSGCHYPGGAVPDLSYEGAKTSIIGKASTVHPGKIFVVPGDLNASFLHQKIGPNLSAELGGRMPVGSVLSAEQMAAVETWITNGASTECTDIPIGIDAGGPFHPAGFREPSVHGTEMKLQMQDCRTCHGADLTGGIGPSCDSCHQAEWRTTCTYCHGGTDNTSGAPPRDLNGVVQTDQLTFRAHTQHTTAGKHPAYDCTMCHNKPMDVLSVGHAFDEEPKTPGHAEVNFGAGLSPVGQYAGNGACNNLYCHGNGRTTGNYDHTMPEPACGSCHPVQASGSTAWRNLSGDHRTHLREGFTCDECHSMTVGNADNLVNADLHVDGLKQVLFRANGFTMTGNRCSGTCHFEVHTNRTW